MKKLFFFAALFAVLIVSSACAEIRMSAEVDRASATTDDAVTYKLVVSSSEKNIPQPRLPNFQGFNVLSRAQSTTLNFSKLGAKSLNVYACVLVPQKAGKLTIDPAKITFNNKNYYTDPIDIEVKPGKPQPKQEPAKEIPGSDEPQLTL